MWLVAIVLDNAGLEKLFYEIRSPGRIGKMIKIYVFEKYAKWHIPLKF